MYMKCVFKIVHVCGSQRLNNISPKASGLNAYLMRIYRSVNNKTVMLHRAFGIKTIMVSYVSIDTHIHQRTYVTITNAYVHCTYIRANVSW